MLGWILTFALLALLGVCMLLASDPGPGSLAVKLATSVFGALFFTCVLTRAARRRV